VDYERLGVKFLWWRCCIPLPPLRGRKGPRLGAGPVSARSPVEEGLVLWEPSRDVIERCRLKRFMDQHGVSSFSELLARASSDLEWFWGAAAQDIGVRFERPYRQVLDTSRGLEWARWWRGAEMNIVASCLDQHLEVKGERIALIWEGEPGEVRRLSYGELDREVSRLAAGLRSLGVEAGDRVGIFLPMLPETAIALLAGARIGAVLIPLFSGFGPSAIASRLNDCGAKALLCADGFYRRGKIIPMKEVADEAIAQCSSVRHLVVLNRAGRQVPWHEDRDRHWEDLVENASGRVQNVHLDPEAPLMIIHTSGTSGRPKGALHVHGGFPIKAAQDLAHAFDMGGDDLVFWFTDIGWMMGPWMILGSLILGGAMFLYEGSPDTPQPDRLWRMVAGHGVSILGVSPTLIRSLMGAGEDLPHRHDLSSLRVLGGTGEPWNPEPFQWFFRHVGGSRIPIINYTGGTEISGGILGGNLLSPLRPCSFAGPLPGIAADVVDETGGSVRQQVGELVIRQPWPGMARGFWGDRQRYLDTYWSRLPGTWVHGDWAYIASDGLWYVLGRSDDTIKVGGKRLGPAEVESILVAHPSVLESAAVGVPDELKGESVACFVVLRPGVTPSMPLAEELQDRVAEALGKPLRPHSVHFVADLPRTRNAKILRRVVRAVYLDQDPGDLSGLENPGALDGIKAAGG
jgi:acetyl-CoA synthetase